MKRENFFGRDLNVGTREEIIDVFRDATTTPRYYAVNRCIDQDITTLPPAIRARTKRTLCEQCDELCYYDPVNLIPHAMIICMRCLPKDNKRIDYANRAVLDEIVRGLRK